MPSERDLTRIVWSPLNVPLFWAAASDSPSCPVLEWIMAAASHFTQPLQFLEGQINPREAAKSCDHGESHRGNTRRFSCHTPREPHQCSGTRGVAQSRVCGGCEGGLVGNICGHGSSCWEAVQCSCWRFRFQRVGTVGRNRPSRGIVDSRSHAEIMPRGKFRERFAVALRKLANDELGQIRAWKLFS